MKSLILAVVGAGILVIGLMGVPNFAEAGKNFTLQGRTQGHCKLANVVVGKQLYNGNCTIKETVGGSSPIIFQIKMGNAEPFLFAGDENMMMYGSEEVKFSDRGSWGIFRWGDFRLEVHEE